MQKLFTEYYNEAQTSDPKKTTSIKVTMDYATGQGVNLYVMPVEREQCDGYAMESMGVFRGFRAFIAPVKRKNAKKFQAITGTVEPFLPGLVAAFENERMDENNERVFTPGTSINQEMDKIFSALANV